MKPFETLHQFYIEVDILSQSRDYLPSRYQILSSIQYTEFPDLYLVTRGFYDRPIYKVLLCIRMVLESAW